MAGAALVALSRDRYFQQGERLALDAGPFVAALEYATGAAAARRREAEPRLLRGRGPEPRARRPDRSVAMVGDDLWSDVEGAQRAGLQGWLVRTGKFREDLLRSSSDHARPDPLQRRRARLRAVVSFRPPSSGVRLRFRRLLPLLVLVLPLRLAGQAPADSASGRRGRDRRHAAGRGARPPGHLRPRRARLGGPAGQRAPHPDPGRHHPPGAPLPSGRAVRLRARRRVGAEPPGARHLPAGADRLGAHRLRPDRAGAHQGRLEHQGRLAVPEHRRRGGVHHRPGGGQPARHRVVRRGPVPEDPRPLHRDARLPPAPAVRRRRRPDRGLRGPLRRAAAAASRSSSRSTRCTSRRGFRLEAEDRDERVLRFFDGAERGARHPHPPLLAGARLGGLGASRLVRRVPAARACRRRSGAKTSGRRATTAPFPKTVTGAVGPYVTWSRRGFLVTQGVAGFAREEDVDLGLTVRLGAAGVAPKAFGYERDGRRPAGQRPARRAGARADSAIWRRWPADCTTRAGSTAARCSSPARRCCSRAPTRWASCTSRAGGWRIRCPARSSISGWAPGPRAFRSHAFTGDRSYFGTAEYRVTVVDDFLGMIGLGIAGFVDHGGAWYAGSPRRTGWDAGIGLRLGASRSTDTDALRFDLARRFGNDAQRAGLGRHGRQGVRLLAARPLYWASPTDRP